jgi:hypothetical protein
MGVEERDMVTLVLPLLLMLARAQTPQPYTPPPVNTIDLSGPRVGMTLLSDGVRSTLRNRYGADIGPVVSQFGWQKEKQFLGSANGLTGVTEWVMLVGGVEHGVLLPSLNWMVGVRSAKGIEFAVGPNLTPAGLGLAAATGVTFRAGNINFPINFAAVRSQSGVRVSLLAGFNTR